MAKKSKKNRKSKKTKKRSARRIPFINSFFNNLFDFILSYFYVFIIAAVLTAGAYFAAAGIAKSDYFTIKNVEMYEIDADNKAAKNIEMSFSIKDGLSIFKVDLYEWQDKMQRKYPEFKNIKVNKVLPDKLAVYFKKRVPICKVKTQKNFLIAKGPVVLPLNYKYDAGDLPVVLGVRVDEGALAKDRKLKSPGLKRAIELIEQISKTDFGKTYRIVQIDVYDPLNPVLYLENGIQLKIGSENFSKKEPALKEVLKDLESKNLMPRFIDLRFEDIVVTPK